MVPALARAQYVEFIKQSGLPLSLHRIDTDEQKSHLRELSNGEALINLQR